MRLTAIFSFVSDVLSRYAFSWRSSLVKYARRTTEVRKCSSVITATAVRFDPVSVSCIPLIICFCQDFICSA